MVFTQGPYSPGESFGYEHWIASVKIFSDGDGGTPSLFVQAANHWYDIRDTCIVRFVADGCRKNLPLDVTDPSNCQTANDTGSRCPTFSRFATSPFGF